MAAFSSSVLSTTSFGSVDIQRCVVVVVATDAVRKLRCSNAVLADTVVDKVVVTRGAHATATLRADALRRNRAATILHKLRLLLTAENMCNDTSSSYSTDTTALTPNDRNTERFVLASSRSSCDADLSPSKSAAEKRHCVDGQTGLRVLSSEY
jgi:hypothetical protein